MITPKNNEQIISSAKKILEDKKLVSAYLRGEISKERLDERGIKLAMPLQR
jgi:hypothetical protein